MKLKHLSHLLQWALIIATLFVVGDSLLDNWREVQKLEIKDPSWLYAIASLGVSLIAHCLSAIFWGEIFGNLQHPVPRRWALAIFLKTEIAKYLPGDVVQVYSRIRAARKIGVPITVGIATTLLQSVYIGAAGLWFGLLVAPRLPVQQLCGLFLLVIFVCVHPLLFDRFMQIFERFPKSSVASGLRDRFPQYQWYRPRMRRYPILPILGQVFVLGLRGISFWLAVLVFTPVGGWILVPLFGGFGLAWALGIVSPISGGVGVFEATAIGLLDKIIPGGVVLGAVILYRLLAIITEAIGTGIGLSFDRRLPTSVQ
jgi:glycosyltransferase 2 family protein